MASIQDAQINTGTGKQVVDTNTYELISSIYSEDNFDKDPRIFMHAGNPTDILGYPMMFSNSADPTFKAGSHTYGRVEFNTLVKNMPLVFIQPGKTKYLPGKSMLSKIFGNSEGEEIYKILQDLSATRDGDRAMEAINKIQLKSGMRYDSRYYGFKPAYDEFIKFVSAMSSYVLIRMNLADADFRVTSTNHTDKWLQKTMIPIYADTSSTRFSESGSNSTADSMLAGQIKNAGSLSREIDFLFNGTANNMAEQIANSAGVNSVSEMLGGIGDTLFGGSTISGSIDHILSGAKTVINGGNLIFPEIWQDSQYSKTYDIGIKLYSPYGDPLSIYNNIYHPLLCLLALALPRQLNKQGYAAPFLVKVFSKGWFSCDMGMVQSISITKGGASGKEWTEEGYPLAVDVNLSIKDLYPTIMQTMGKTSDIYSFNTGMLEFLDCLAATEPGDIDYMLGIKASVFDSLLGNTMLSKINASFAQSGLSNAIHAVIGSVGQVPETFEFVTNQIKGTISGIVDLFSFTDSDKSSTENALGQGNYSNIE